MTNTSFIGAVGGGEQTVDRISPHVGYKVVALKVAKDDSIKIVGPHHSAKDFELSDNSQCKKNHKSFENCSCGFYAYNNVTKAIGHWDAAVGGYSNMAIVEVALSGKVIVAEHGFRAEHQRITKVLMPRCWNCSNKGTALVKHSAGFMVTACDDCTVKFDIADDTISFEDFAAKVSPTGYKPIIVESCKNFTTDAENFLDPTKKMRDIKQIIDELQRKGDLLSLDEVITYAQNSMLSNPE